MEGSPNAFSNAMTTQHRGPNNLTEQDTNARPAKRPRLSEDAVAAIHTQRASAETSLEVDHMILDYLAFEATTACFTSRKFNGHHTSTISLSKSVALVDTFLALFKERHPTYTPDAELRFRIQLLRLATLFTQRLTRNPTTPSSGHLRELRDENARRAAQWINLAGPSPCVGLEVIVSIPEDHLERNRAQNLHQLGVPPEDEQYEDAHYGTLSCISLLDILPQFMRISAARNAIAGSVLNQRWMHLASEFMLQACLEGVLVYGNTDVIDEAFSWGYLEGLESLEAVNQAGQCNTEVNAMFEDEDYAVEVESWKDVRKSYFDLLMPAIHADDGDVAASQVPQLETLASTYPIAIFESSLAQFLEANSNSIAAPVLAQIERGRLDGMTEQETMQFLHDCGPAVAQFFETTTGFKDGVVE